MQGNQAVIDAMNDGLTIELTAINMYFIQSKMCRDWGFEKLAAHYHAESIEEMQHAELLIDRILFLEGVPEIARYDVIHVGKSIQEQLENSHKLELGAVTAYNAAIKLAIDSQDSGSREIMDRILKETEDSVDWVESQLHLVETIGIELYSAQQVGTPAAP